VTPAAAAADGTPTRPEFIEEERVIYARPYEGPFGTRVRMLWFLFPFGGVIVGAYLSKPDLRRRGEVVKDGAEGVTAPAAALATGQSVDRANDAGAAAPAGDVADEWVM
jgi:hypothetical protein